MIIRPHIIIRLVGRDKIVLEKSENNIEPEDADRKYVTDVFKAFPDVQFTLENIKTRISYEKAIDIQKKYQNVNFEYLEIS